MEKIQKFLGALSFIDYLKLNYKPAEGREFFYCNDVTPVKAHIDEIMSNSDEFWFYSRGLTPTRYVRNFLVLCGAVNPPSLLRTIH